MPFNIFSKPTGSRPCRHPRVRTSNSSATAPAAPAGSPCPQPPAPVPLVLMAHGFGATRDMHLEQYAQRFNAAGMATLIFDYRGFGASDGEPRNCVNAQKRNCRLARRAGIRPHVARCRSPPHCAVGHVVCWRAGDFRCRSGRSGGGHRQPVPLTGRPWPPQWKIARYAGPLSLLRVSAHGVLDAARATLGLTPHYIPIVARTGDVGAMTSADAWGRLRAAGAAGIPQ
jgi:hypothetical protein